MMGGRRRTEEHAMCSCFSLLLQSRTFCERADISMISTPWSAVRTSNSPLQVEYILSVVIAMFVD